MSQDDDGTLVADLAPESHIAGTLPLDRAQLELLCEALVDYPPRTLDDPTIGLCWDACRLASVVVIPTEFLSTEAARAQRARAPRRRSDASPVQGLDQRATAEPRLRTLRTGD
jgi:hypothetical protein